MPKMESYQSFFDFDLLADKYQSSIATVDPDLIEVKNNTYLSGGSLKIR